MPRYTLDNEKVSRIIAGEYSSLRAAARAIGISPSYLSKVLTGKREPGRKFIDGILMTFKEIKFEEIFIKVKD